MYGTFAFRKRAESCVSSRRCDPSHQNTHNSSKRPLRHRKPRQACVRQNTQNSSIVQRLAGHVKRLSARKDGLNNTVETDRKKKSTRDEEAHEECLQRRKSKQTRRRRRTVAGGMVASRTRARPQQPIAATCLPSSSRSARSI